MKLQQKNLRFLCVWMIFVNGCASETFPRAQNVTWSSLNFKTLLTWSPKPTNYSYTVEFSQRGQDRERTPLCIQTSDTECDLTTALTNLKGRYMAEVQSEPKRGSSSDLTEFPHTASGWFCPYNDTMIGRPEFRIAVSKDQRTITLYVKDIQTAVLNGQKQSQSIRDIFKDDLQYKVFYRKAKSTGKKEKISTSSTIEVTNLDQGVSYCFTVQALIRSRSPDKQHGEISHVQCSPEEHKSFFDDYSLPVIASAILVIAVIVSVVIAVIVMCCKRRQKTKKRGMEGVPLKGV
ncbi:coagulation factor III, tissue factor a [Brachyhypopomus gauderio]|uniref:coagulation factor III, tissue factor a n=1 Tax=Brachyhypopomus gauderio TaxID=698409 RepID=UPI004041B0B1